MDESSRVFALCFPIKKSLEYGTLSCPKKQNWKAIAVKANMPANGVIIRAKSVSIEKKLSRNLFVNFMLMNYEFYAELAPRDELKGLESLHTQ